MVKSISETACSKASAPSLTLVWAFAMDCTSRVISLDVLDEYLKDVSATTLSELTAAILLATLPEFALRSELAELITSVIVEL
ncbi:YrvL family regulatory protein [Lacrimispora sp.]|uniref:YrvL family regulatory protein n=1 Tax=Lacrimispora sp. TaxID=2719234 RepID=UPI0039E24646